MFTIASEETYEAGQLILKEGSSGDWVHVVLSGSVEISRIVGGKKYIVGTVREGEVFGELSFLGGVKRTASATAKERTTLGTIDRAYLDSEFNKISADFRSILVSMVKRYAQMLERACDFTERSEPRTLKTLSLNYKDRNAFVKAYTSDVSIGGLFIKTDKPFRKGEQFQLKLQLPSLPEPMTIQTEVAWTRGGEGSENREPSGMGVKFVKMEAKDRDIIEKYIKNVRGRSD